MIPKTVETFYAQIALVLDLFLGTLVCSLNGLVLVGCAKIQFWETSFGLLVMNLIVTDIVNGLIGILQATELHLLVNEIESSGFFKIILVLQALFIRTSLFTIVVLNLSRLVVIVAPFYYSEIFSINKTRIILLVIWISGIIECTVKYFTKIASTYTFYSSGVLFNIILNVAVLALAGLIIICLKKSVDDCAVREKATKTVVIVSVIFFFSYGYYNYAVA